MPSVGAPFCGFDSRRDRKLTTQPKQILFWGDFHLGELVGDLGGLFGGANSEGFGLDQLLANLQEFQDAAARSAQRMAIETASARSKDDLVEVWVNAQGVVVRVEFNETLLAEATGTESGASVVQAAQAAAAKMRAKTDAFQAGLWQQVSRFGGQPLNEIDEFKAIRPDVPLSEPGSRERRAFAEKLGPETDHPDADPQDWRLTIRDTD